MIQVLFLSSSLLLKAGTMDCQVQRRVRQSVNNIELILLNNLLIIEFNQCFLNAFDDEKEECDV
jgi:hypothetical protein